MYLSILGQEIHANPLKFDKIHTRIKEPREQFSISECRTGIRWDNSKYNEFLHVKIQNRSDPQKSLVKLIYSKCLLCCKFDSSSPATIS